MKNATSNPSYAKFQSYRARIRGITVAELEAREAKPSFDHIPAMVEKHVARVREQNAAHEAFFGQATE